MKILIFSDTHLNNKFDLKKYNFLVKIISQADKVIINGDFWDSWFTSFDQFVTSEWKGLFPLLLKRKTVYVHGNHDPESSVDGRVGLFSIENTNSFTLKINGQKFTIVHGDKLLRSVRPRVLKIYGKILNRTEGSFVGRVIRDTLRVFEWVLFKCLGAEFMTNSSVSKNDNNLIKKNKPDIDGWLVCGDTHCLEIDRKVLYANSGSVRFGLGTYLVIEGGKVFAYKEVY